MTGIPVFVSRLKISKSPTIQMDRVAAPRLFVRRDSAPIPEGYCDQQ